MSSDDDDTVPNETSLETPTPVLPTTSSSFSSCPHTSLIPTTNLPHRSISTDCGLCFGEVSHHPLWVCCSCFKCFCWEGPIASSSDEAGVEEPHAMHHCRSMSSIEDESKPHVLLFNPMSLNLYCAHEECRKFVCQFEDPLEGGAAERIIGMFPEGLHPLVANAFRDLTVELSDERFRSGPAYPPYFRVTPFFVPPQGESVNEEESVSDILVNCLTRCTPMIESPDGISRRCAMEKLQGVLASLFGRKAGKHDAHGVRNYTVERNITELDPDEEFLTYRIEFVDRGSPDLLSELQKDVEIDVREFKLSVRSLADQARQFVVFYVPEFVGGGIEGIREHFDLDDSNLGKVSRRAWNRIFEKHYYVQLSPVEIAFDNVGVPIPSSEQQTEEKKPIWLCTAVGFDVSANRHTGVHFADFLYLLTRKDGRDVLEEVSPEHPEPEPEEAEPLRRRGFLARLFRRKRPPAVKPKEKRTVPIERPAVIEGIPDIRKSILWDESFSYWISVNRQPQNHYILNVERLFHSYSVQFALMFRALQVKKVEVPIVCAIGCGVFGRCFFPEYQETLIRAYSSVLSQNDYGFKAVVLTEVSERNVNVFRRVLLEQTESEGEDEDAVRCKVPFILCQFDMLVVARLISEHYSTSLMNAGDLWEFGQYWEGGGALEEYIARMTTGYFSQHPAMNPRVFDASCYSAVAVADLGIEVDQGLTTELVEFVRHIRQELQ